MKSIYLLVVYVMLSSVVFGQELQLQAKKTGEGQSASNLLLPTSTTTLHQQRIGCIADLVLNQTSNVLNGQTISEQVSNTIQVTNTIFKRGIANYQAAVIVLKPGFHAKKGSVTSLSIAPCVGTSATNRHQANLTKSEGLTEIKRAGNIYPNPTTGPFFLEVPVHSQTRSEQSTYYWVGVYDLLGTQVLEQRLERSVGKIKIDLTGRPKGVYVVKYAQGGEIIIQKVIYK